MAAHSTVLAWRIPGTGEPGGLPSLGSRRVGHDWSDLAAAAVYIKRGFPGGSGGKESALQCRRSGFYSWVGKIPQRRKWHPTPVFFFLNLFLLLIEGWWLYKILLFPIRHQHESVIGIHMFSPSWTSLPTPVFLPGELHEQKSLVGYIPRVTDKQTWLSS